MFGFHVKTVITGTRLTITNPADILMLLLFLTFTVLPLVNFILERPLSIKKVVIHRLITFCFYGYFINVTQLRLDKETQLASIRHFQWFHWRDYNFPIDKIEHAYLATGSGTNQIVLQYHDGSIADFSIQNQMSGKENAVLQINRFLGLER